jgi:hypothetical protein
MIARGEPQLTGPAWVPVAESAGAPELRGEAVIVVKAAEHRVCCDLYGALPAPGRGCPGSAWAVLRDALDSLVRTAFVVVGDEGRYGSAMPSHPHAPPFCCSAP